MKYLAIILVGLVIASAAIAARLGYDGQQQAVQAKYWEQRTGAAMADVALERDGRRADAAKATEQIRQLQSASTDTPQRGAPACAKTFMEFLQVPTRATAEAAFPCLNTAMLQGASLEQLAQSTVNQPSIGRSVGYMAGAQFKDGSWVTAWVAQDQGVGYLVYLDSEGKVRRLE